MKALTNAIVAITAFHNHMGNVAEYLVNPTYIPFLRLHAPACARNTHIPTLTFRYSGGKITPGSTMSDTQASFQGLNIALTTAVPMPMLLGDFTHLLHRDDKLSQTREVFARFQVGVQLSFVCDSQGLLAYMLLLKLFLTSFCCRRT